MAEYLKKTWTKEALREYFSDESSTAGVFPFVDDDGKVYAEYRFILEEVSIFK